jgi:nucleoside-diphosphate-sugar epimerase
MPTLSSGDKALVTGSNGYLAMWIIRVLLERGYSVRGAVRSAEKGKHLQDYFASYGTKFELSIVPDITKVCKLLASYHYGVLKDHVGGRLR